MTYQRLALDFNGPVAVLRFKHPEVMNAVGAQMLAELKAAVIAVADPACRNIFTIIYRSAMDEGDASCCNPRGQFMHLNRATFNSAQGRQKAPTRPYR